MRALGSMETALYLTNQFAPLNLVSVVRLAPGPSPAMLRQALDTLQARHAELRVRIVERGGQLLFEPAQAGPIPLQVMAPPGDEDWQRVVETEINTRVPSATGPLARCTYLYSPAPDTLSTLVLTCHHTIVDGAAMLNLWCELLALAGGQPLPATATDELALPSERLFPAHFRGWHRQWAITRFMAGQMGAEMTYQMRSVGRRQPPIHAEARNCVRVLRVPAAVTGPLVRVCRAKRLTMHSALSAAMLLAVQRALYAGQAGTLRGITFGSLRAHLQPPLEPAAPGAHIAMLRYSANLQASQPFWPLARHIQQQIDQMARRSERLAAALLAPMLIRTTNQLQAVRLAHVALSYVGAPAMPPAFGELQVHELHAFVSNHRLGPEYTAVAQLVGEELLFDIVYLDADLNRVSAQAIADLIQASLAEAGNQT